MIVTIVSLSSLALASYCVQGQDFHFDVQNGSKEFILSSTQKLSDDQIRRIPTPLFTQILGYGPIFGRKADEVIYSALTQTGSRALFSQSGKSKSVQLTSPSVKAVDYLCSLSPDRRQLFFLRSKNSRATSMGGRTLGDIDLWTRDFRTGKEKQLTHLSMFSARLSQRCGTPNTVYIVSQEKNQPKTRLLGVSLKDSSITSLFETTEDISGYSVSSDLRSIYYATGNFPVSLFTIPLAGGTPKKLGTYETMSDLIAEGKFLYFVSFKYGGTNYGISKLDLQSKKVSSVKGSIR